MEAGAPALERPADLTLAPQSHRTDLDLDRVARSEPDVGPRGFRVTADGQREDGLLARAERPRLIPKDELAQ